MGTATNSLPAMALKKALSLKRIGWLYPIFRDLHFYHGPSEKSGLAARRTSDNRIFRKHTKERGCEPTRAPSHVQ